MAPQLLGYPATTGERQAAGRACALLFALPGGVAAASAWLDGWPPHSELLAFGAGELALAAVVALLPWARWPLRASLAAALGAASLLAVMDVLQMRAHNPIEPYTYAIWFIGGYVWVGMNHPRWASLWLTPTFAAIFIAPLLLSSAHPPDAAWAALAVFPIGVTVGETTAWWRDRARRAADRFRALVRLTADGIAVVRPDGRVRFATEAAADLLGVVPHDLHRRPLLDLIDPRDRGRVAAVARDVGRAHRASARAEFRAHARGSSAHWLEATVTNLRDESSVRGDVWDLRDIRQRKLAEEELAHRAEHDALTGLSNRGAGLRVLAEWLGPHGAPARDVAVFYLDLDEFKTVNDSLGHAAGDLLLRTFAMRVRDVAADGDRLVRLGGDEFLLLARGLDGEEAALALAERILQAVARPVDLDGVVSRITVSIGIARATAGADGPLLIRRADAALYRAKANGRDQAALFDARRDTLSARRGVSAPAPAAGPDGDELPRAG